MIPMLATPDLADTEGMPAGTTLLNGQFLIESRLQTGGFGITYVARDSLHRQVVVKECFPSGICTRGNGRVEPVSPDLEVQFAALKRQFVREARQMAKLTHPNIVAVHQVFEENNTAYMALDQVIGTDLATLSEDQPYRITNAFLHTLLDQMLKAIGHTHDHGLLHRDIAPDNILIDEDNHVTLIDFGASLDSCAQATGNQSAIVAVKDGYSPHEFYVAGAKHDFSSDLYSLGATLYQLITGSPPPDCQGRFAAVSSGLPDSYLPLASSQFDFDYNILATVDRALELTQKNRFQSAKDWSFELENTPKTRPARRSVTIFDPFLETKIAQIVETTNSLLEQKKREARPIDKAVPGDRMRSPEPKKIVDIFGNEIDDLEAWQAEQELEIQARKQNHEPRKVSLRKAHGYQSDSKSARGARVSRCVPRQNLSASTHSK